MDCLADGQGISTVASDQRGQEKKETTDYGIKKEKKKGFSGKENLVGGYAQWQLTGIKLDAMRQQTPISY